MAGMISEAWAYAIDPAIKHHFYVGFNRVPKVGPALFSVSASQQAYEYVFGSGALGVDAWEDYENSGVVPSADYNQGYKKTFTHSEKVMQVGINRKLWDDRQMAAIFNIPQQIGDSAGSKREIDAASVFVNAFSDTYAGADAVGLCSTAHPHSPSNTGDTQSNEGTYALTKENVGLTRLAMMEFTDDKNQLVAVRPDLLLVPPELEDTALEISKSLLDPTSANNTVNPQAGRFRVLVWPYLTDSNAWFMIDSAKMRQHLMWFDRVPLQIAPKVEDKTVRANWIAYMRYSFGWTDWRWVYGNNPS